MPSSEYIGYVVANLLRTGLLGQCPALLAAWWMFLPRQKVEKNSIIITLFFLSLVPMRKGPLEAYAFILI